MKILSNKCIFTLWLLFLPCLLRAYGDTITCYTKKSPCFLKQLKCPSECPSQQPSNAKAKACYLNCNSPICKPECRNKKPNCNGPGAACLDPRFIGGDGIVFYFHGNRNEHFSLVSDPHLHINARFIGLRPAGRLRDFTWIQALGILFNTHTFSVEATNAEKWDHEVDHLKFFYDGQELGIPEGYPSLWVSSSDDCFAHLEVQFRFYGLSAKVEGVLGRTYQPEFVNPAKPGVAMPIVGGEDKYRTSSLLATDCALCVFSSGGVLNEEDTLLVEPVQSTIDCASGLNSGNGIVCLK